jgi:hypothetical protein
MNHRKIALLAVTAAILVPALCNASPEKDALNACARAFATSLASPGKAAPTYKVAYSGAMSSGSVLDFFNREYTFELHAKNEQSGLALAHASCTATDQGTIVSLSPVPTVAQN